VGERIPRTALRAESRALTALPSSIRYSPLGLVDICPGPPGRLSALSVSHSKSVLCGPFVWARRALNGQKRWFSARAVDLRVGTWRAAAPLAGAAMGLGRTVALHHRSPTSYQIHEQVRYLYFGSDSATEPVAP
jgi:hypothetical protein